MSCALCFDTTSATTAAAVHRNGTCLDARKAQINYQAEELLGLVDSILKDTGTALEDLDSVVVASGPGSFTGIRTGIATARGLGAARRINQFGISLPLAYGLCRSTPGTFVVPYLNANTSEQFYAVYYHPRPDEKIEKGTHQASGTLLRGPLIEVQTIDVVEAGGVEASAERFIAQAVSQWGAEWSGLETAYVSISEEKNSGNSADVLGSAVGLLGNGSGETGQLTARALDRYALDKANPLYVKAVNAPTLAERAGA